MGINVGQITYGSKVTGYGSSISKLNKLDSKFTDLGNKADKNEEDIEGLREAIRDTGTVTALTENRVTRFISSLQEGNGILGQAKEKVQGLTDAIRSLGIASTVTSIGATIKGSLAGLGASISSTLSSTILATTTGIATVGGTIGAILGGAVVRGLQVTGVMDKVGQIGTMVRRKVGPQITDTFLGLTAPLLAPFTTLGAFVDGFIKGLFTDGLSGAVSQGIAKANKSINLFKNKWLEAYSPVIDATNFVVNKVQTITDGIGNAIDKAGQLTQKIPQIKAPNINIASNGNTDATVNATPQQNVTKQETKNEVKQDITVQMESKIDPRNLTRKEIEELNRKLNRQVGEDLTDRLG